LKQQSFHVFGFFATFSMLTWGASVVFPEKLPASVSEINFALSENKCTAMSAPPLILEQMMANLKETNDFSHVQHIKYVLFGGAPLKEEAGNWFLDHHFNVRDMYGTTEIGAIMTSDCNPKSRNWGSVRPFMADEQGTPYCVFEDAADAEPGLKHMYVRAGTPHLANGIVNRPDGGYDTNDLFKENPNYPGTYTYVGRRDDTLIMENGEKTNPVPMETAIRQSNVVSQVAVLGHGRQCTAALVTIDLDSSMNLSPDEIVSHVHDAVKEANKECPSHSTILPQMVKILPFNKSLPSTDKGTVMRKKAEQNYKDIVEKLYKDFLEGPVRSKNENVDVSTWSSEQAKQFLIQSAADVLGLSPSDFKDPDQSIFDLGLNSLSSIQLRNKIAEYFDNVPQNFLFQHPSINSMAEALMSEEKEDILEQAEKRSQQCHDLANAYIKKAKNDFGVAKNFYSDKKDKVILLTGVTGSLGSFMLRDFLLDPSVKKVYCCIRGKQKQLWDRLVHAFKSRSLDVSLLENTDRVEALPLRFADEFLGFGKEKYNKLKDEVTIIQHCAWLLDFNMPVDHYDKECIAPFYNLLKFAYKDVDPMHVHFISSVSASAAAGGYIEEEPLPFDVHVTMPMGYAHSKFIVEILFNYLATEKNFPCYIERLGQVCGDSENGVWNVSEQYPLLFMGGANVMHKMPALDTSVDWITVDYASATICKVMLETAHLPANEGRTVFHIVNPRIIHWSDVLEAMKQAGMKFDIVSPTEWVEFLSKDQSNPAYTLMSFFEANFNESFKMPIWKTEHTAETAPVINDCPIVDANLFSKFLTRWETVGFYNPAI
jgi:thioester reductase-like protein